MITLYLFIIGIAIGSFLNVLIDRLSNEESIMGRSHCDFCKHTLSWTDLIPVVSFIFLHGRCRYCKKKLSWQYPLIEILTGSLFALISYFFLMRQGGEERILTDAGLIFPLAASLAIGAVLLVIFVADSKYQIIPDEMQIAFFVSVLFYKISLHTSLSAIGISVLEGVGVMSLILIIYLLTKGRGMGFGDVKLALVIGFFLGLKMGFLALYFGFIYGAIVGIALLLLKKKKLKSKMAFGPFLIAGMVTVLLWSPELARFLYTLYGI